MFDLSIHNHIVITSAVLVTHPLVSSLLANYV